ncbi:hypothetical protein [Alicyclobacillus kakegawensis]|uniref:hypothetical protein n=1 Tax=Alicyclobacillus kakegawensis TaxID=392012 RepID=UPI00082CF839|nr:hypothetical protein [Alicyclobacillus kakegawensis]
MNDELESLWRTGKRLLAAVVFVCLLVGAGSAVLTALAAGINSLSQFSAGRGPSASASAPASTQPGAYANAAATVSNAVTGGSDGAVSATESADGQGASTLGGASAGGSASEAGTDAGAGSVSSSQGGEFYSPVGEAIDQGGVVLGDKVQQGFGHLLGSVLRALFFEQPAGTAGGNGDAGALSDTAAGRSHG